MRPCHFLLRHEGVLRTGHLVVFLFHQCKTYKLYTCLCASKTVILRVLMQSTRLQYKLKSISSKNTIHTTKAKHFVTAWYEKPKNYCEKWGRGNFSSACTQKDKHEI